MAIYKRSREVELGATENNIRRLPEWDLNQRQTDFKSGALTIRPRCLLHNRHVGYINILTWLRGFQVKLLYLVLFSLYLSLFWELRDKLKLEKFANLTRKPRSHVSILIYRTGLLADNGWSQKIFIETRARSQIAPNYQVGIHIWGSFSTCFSLSQIASDYNGRTILLYAHGWRAIIVGFFTFPFLKQST